MSGSLEGSIKSLGEQSRLYIEKLKADVTKQKEAVQSGNKKSIEKSLEQGAKDTKAGASHAKSNPKLYKLASKTAPEQLEKTAKAIEGGTASGAAVTKLMGEFDEQVRADTEQASDM